MSNLQTPFRYDFVGSFLRPQALKDAKVAYQNEKITKEELDKIANEEITKIVVEPVEDIGDAVEDISPELASLVGGIP